MSSVNNIIDQGIRDDNAESYGGGLGCTPGLESEVNGECICNSTGKPIYSRMPQYYNCPPPAKRGFFGGRRKSRKGAGLFGPSICNGNERVEIKYPDGSSFIGPCSKRPSRSDGVLVGPAGPPSQKFGYGGRKSRKGRRKSRKGRRKSGRKSRKY